MVLRCFFKEALGYVVVRGAFKFWKQRAKKREGFGMFVGGRKCAGKLGVVDRGRRIAEVAGGNTKPMKSPFGRMGDIVPGKVLARDEKWRRRARGRHGCCMAGWCW